MPGWPPTERGRAPPGGPRCDTRGRLAPRHPAYQRRSRSTRAYRPVRPRHGAAPSWSALGRIGTVPRVFGTDASRDVLPGESGLRPGLHRKAIVASASPATPATSSAAITANDAATALWRRVQRARRSKTVLRRARTGRSSRNRWRSSASAAAQAVAGRLRLLEAFQADGLQVARQPRLRAALAAPALRVATCSSVSSAVAALERRPAGEQLVEDRPQGVDVGRPGRSRCAWPCACSGAM